LRTSTVCDSFGIDDTFEPFLAVLHLPKRKGMDTPEGHALASRTFNSAEKTGIVAVADYAHTQNPVFLPLAEPYRCFPAADHLRHWEN